MNEKHVGIVGARSPIGKRLISKLTGDRCMVHAFTRQNVTGRRETNVTWTKLPEMDTHIEHGSKRPIVPLWIFVAHIWILADFYRMLEEHGARRIVALSSTSLFTKSGSNDAKDRGLADRLARAEENLMTWASRQGVEWTILRPTLIYGGGTDRNISEIASIIRRFGCFPLLGRADGLRQPVHVDDVAEACIAAIEAPQAINKSYNISGLEILTYREMATRVFEVLDHSPRFVPFPLRVIKAGIGAIRIFPRYRHWTAAMAERMNLDMVFDHCDATKDFGFVPRPFTLEHADVVETPP